jgi:phenylalanyl-tRNA synthetase beta chain
MKIPLSWLKDYIDIDLSLVDIARLLTNTGLEVDEITVVGLPIPSDTGKLEFRICGLPWSREHFVVAQIDEVMSHPNADRLVLCRLNDGKEELVVLTGAPNLFDYKGTGPLAKPLKVAYAREGAELYDGHQPGQVLTTLKRTKIRGVESFSMVCSEKELGISEEHEGIIILDPDAPTGMPLADYMGDAVYDISILPNMIRNASVIGVAREIAAVTGKPLRMPKTDIQPKGESVKGKVGIQISDPNLNPRFVVGMLRNANQIQSPYWVQRRLRMAGMRPINAVVDATNYVMLETGEPLHAFDYDVLVKRAKGKTPTIITRPAKKGEKLVTLDNVERTLEDYTIMVCDTAGALSLAGVMGGLESEITDTTRNILLEGAAWNYVNVRRTTTYLHMSSEASFRFGRGVHPALAEQAVSLGLERMAQWSGGEIAPDRVDEYPVPYEDPVVKVTSQDVARVLGIKLSGAEIAALLTRLEFVCKVDSDEVSAKSPAHRIDIGTGVVGKADVMEEIARLYGYDNIPETRLKSQLPPAHNDSLFVNEERMRDILARLGVQEVINYRLTSKDRELRLTPPGAPEKEEVYITLANPFTPERSVMRRSLTASILDILERNIRLREHLAIFEIGKVFLPVQGQPVPQEDQHLAIAMSGKRSFQTWDTPQGKYIDFYDMKGVLEGLFSALHLPEVTYEHVEGTIYHPGKSARVVCNGKDLGIFGELHPDVKDRYDFSPSPVLAGEFNLEVILPLIPKYYDTDPVPSFPPVLEDLALVVPEDMPAGTVRALITQTGGKLLTEVRLFDIFRGEQIGAGMKSLAYSLTYQALDRTLAAAEIAQIRARIIKRLDQELGVKLRA